MSHQTTELQRKAKISDLSRAGVMAAVICVLSPLSIPIGPVPISLATLAIYLSLYLLSWQWAVGSLFVYLLIGMIGMPVFSGFSGGIGKLMGPTGGYIIGFFPMAAAAGWILQKSSKHWIHFLGFVVGTAICYAFGTAWFCYESQTPLAAALSACVIPFIPGDFLKIMLAMAIGPLIRKQLIQAGLMKA